jgi:hypothetical protein
VNPPTVDPPARRPWVYGPEPWAAVGASQWSWWDLWFCIVAAADFGGDLDRLEADLVGRLRSPGWVAVSGEDVESKLSHLSDLCARLAAAGLDASDLAAAGKGPGVLSRARTKIFKQSAGSSKTSAMLETPRVRLEERAHRGHWPAFPVDPASFYEKFRRSVEVDAFIGERRTLTLTGQLWERLCRLAEACRGPADQLALYRAFHTAGLELADRADDGFGCVGDLRADAFEAYLEIDPAEAGMAVDLYWQDLCELLVWEPHALTFRGETLPFRRVKAAQADMIESILFALADEHCSAHLDHQAYEALELVAWLHIAARRYLRYPATAARLGSDRAIPVLALAESALRGHKPDIASAVFAAADRPGRDQHRLRARCLELTGVRLEDHQPPGTDGALQRRQ